MIKKLASIVSLGVAVSAGAAALAGASAPPASAATNDCFKVVNVAGGSAYGWGSPSSLQSDTRMVRTAATATLCLKYAKAFGGYYISGFTCTDSNARVTGDSTSLKSHNPYYIHADRSYLACGTTANWKWHRTIAAEQCTSLRAESSWTINQSTGQIARTYTMPTDGEFVPKAGC